MPRKLAALYGSDLRRAQQSAEIIGRSVGLVTLTEPRLRKINLVAWQGMRYTDIQAQYPNEFRR